MKQTTLIVILSNVKTPFEILNEVRNRIIAAVGTLNLMEENTIATAIAYNGIIPSEHKKLLIEMAETYESTKLLFVEFDDSIEYIDNTLNINNYENSKINSRHSV